MEQATIVIKVAASAVSDGSSDAGSVGIGSVGAGLVTFCVAVAFRFDDFLLALGEAGFGASRDNGMVNKRHFLQKNSKKFQKKWARPVAMPLFFGIYAPLTL